MAFFHPFIESFLSLTEEVKNSTQRRPHNGSLQWPWTHTHTHTHTEHLCAAASAPFKTLLPSFEPVSCDPTENTRSLFPPMATFYMTLSPLFSQVLHLNAQLSPLQLN